MTNWEKYFGTPESTVEASYAFGVCFYRKAMGYPTCRDCALINAPVEECDKHQIWWLEREADE